MLSLSLLNYQTHPLQSCSHFIFSGEKSAFPPGMIKDPILCVLTCLINYSRIGKCKCSCAFVDHKLLRIFKSLFSTLCPQHMIQNRHSIHTFITKRKCRWSGGEWPLGCSGNFMFLQGDTWTVLVTSIWLPKPPGSTLSRIIRWAKTILRSVCLLSPFIHSIFIMPLITPDCHLFHALGPGQHPRLPISTPTKSELPYILKGQLPFLQGLLCAKCSLLSALHVWPHLVPSALL